MEKVVVQAPAKLNLGLDIVGLLPNKYHDLDMIMQTITLYDTVTIEKKPGISLILPGSDILPDENNTACKAARLFFEAAGMEPAAAITVEKVIPAQAGMAGGSADAAAVLVGLNALYGEPLSFNRLLQLGDRVGADVPFSLMGGTCRVQGTGNILKALPPCPDCDFVVIMPQNGTSTPAAFAMYDKMGNPYHPSIASQEAAICKGDLALLAAEAGNSLQACSGTEETEILCGQLMQQGAVKAIMTGSGAAVFGIFEPNGTAVKAAEQLKKQHEKVYLCKPDSFGAKVLK